MSTHVHLVLTDPEARLPAFSQFLASLVARAMNRALGRSESFWGPSSSSAVALERPQAWRDDLLDVSFPAGTYLMRVSHGVACVPTG